MATGLLIGLLVGAIFGVVVGALARARTEGIRVADAERRCQSLTADAGVLRSELHADRVALADCRDEVTRLGVELDHEQRAAMARHADLEELREKISG